MTSGLVAGGFEEAGGDRRIEHRVLEGAGVELAMTLGGVALRRLRRGARSVAHHIAAPRTAPHRDGVALARVLAMREPQLAAAPGAAPAGRRLRGSVTTHAHKGRAHGQRWVG